MRQKFTVTGMTCSACSAHVEKAVSKLDGISAVNVNLLGGSMQVDYDPSVQSPEGIIAAVVESGYGAQLPGAAGEKQGRSAGVPDMKEELAGMKRRLILSFCFFIPLFYLTMGHMVGLPIPAFFHGPKNALVYALTQFLLLLPIMYVNDKYYKVGFKTLAHRSPNMDSLIALGSAAAVVYGLVGIYQIGWGLGHGDMARVEQWSMDLYFESAGTILTLITLGKYMETRSKGKTGEAISRLMDLAPKTATVLRGGKETVIPVEQVTVGDLILVRPGQSIPVDGEIVEGGSSIDESALTGESIPVDKGPGDKVAAASINKSGAFTFRATRVGDDTTLAQMIALVDEAASSKAPIAKLADRVAGVFVPTVICIALVTAAVWLLAAGSIARALTAGVAVLVISCPCALGLATPVAIMVGTGKGAENGILFKSAEALEVLRSVQTVVLDKTGTVTQGKPVVTDLKPVGETTEEELLCVAASLEKPSEHPLAQAVVAEAERRCIPLAPARDFRAVHGRGVIASIQGADFLAGSRAMMEEHHVDLAPAGEVPEALAEAGKTPLYFAQDGRLIG
ncbi:MAG: heavy metal translocating P-type ATPase, partial [Clostridiales bacterium]|nr:heavy metal translocating P-type ATPase [Clostridiales bacterium]